MIVRLIHNFNSVTNWGPMVPAAVVTYGAVLDAVSTDMTGIIGMRIS